MGPKWSGAPGKSTFAWVGAFYALLFILQSYHIILISASISTLLHTLTGTAELWLVTDDHETPDIVSLNGTGVVHYGRHNLSVENLSSSEQSN